ncbi:MAG: PTS sugar transporter subunit IIA [Phycisphaeraceae bacterium]|nr:PTS sugar transporter subunit IIA [Phycisphaerales bacterium]MCB9859301.1 PTS sugar transporter subunit IIA [Phycisphaeraceae bacterium]
MKLLDFIEPQAIVPSLTSTFRDDAIAELFAALVGAGMINEETSRELMAKVLEREKRDSTGFGMGIAVPHTKHVKVTKMMAAVGISRKGIDFQSLDRQPVYSIILLLSPADKPEEHLQAMEAIFTCLNRDSFRRSLRNAENAEAVVELLTEADAQRQAW